MMAARHAHTGFAPFVRPSTSNNLTILTRSRTPPNVPFARDLHDISATPPASCHVLLMSVQAYIHEHPLTLSTRMQICHRNHSYIFRLPPNLCHVGMAFNRRMRKGKFGTVVNAEMALLSRSSIPLAANVAMCVVRLVRSITPNDRWRVCFSFQRTCNQICLTDFAWPR